MAMKVSGMVSGLDTDAMVQELVSAYATKKDKYVKAQTKLEWTMDAWKNVNSKVYSFYTGALSNTRFSTSFNLKTASISNSSVATVTASSSAPSTTQSLSVTQLATSGYLTGGKVAATTAGNVTEATTLAAMGIEDGTISVNGKTIKLTGDMSVAKLTAEVNNAGASMSFDAASQRFFVSSTSSGADNEFMLLAEDENGLLALQNLGLFSITDVNGNDTAEMTYYRNNSSTSDIAKYIVDNYQSLKNSEDSARITAQDAVIKLNGATFTSSTNSFSVNGLTINATATTTAADGTDNPVMVSTAVDTKGIYDKIVSFFSEYNELVTYMDGLYYADSATGYEPLTDEEKESMTDKQIEEWETKVKDALLRKDATLSSISSAMKTSILSATYTTASGEKLSLSSFGIATLSYFTATESTRGTFHIDGNSEDSATSSNADKLMAAIAANPDDVMTFFQNMASSVYTTLTDKMRTSTLSSALTIYNDKEMSSQYSDYNDTIADWEDRIADYEDQYYSKFTAMEKALATLQSKTSALAGLLGNG